MILEDFQLPPLEVQEGLESDDEDEDEQMSE